MKKILLPKPFPVLMAILLLCGSSGCSSFERNSSELNNSERSTLNNDMSESNNSTYSNLDLSNTKVTENVPRSGEWKTMTFDYQPNVNDDTLNVLKAAAKAYNGESIDEKKVFCNVFTNGDDVPPEDIAFPDMTDELYRAAAYMRYIGDDLYIDTTIHGKIELYNRKNVKEILGIDYENGWSWRPFLEGTVKKEFDLQTDSPVTDSYDLNGKQVSVDDALQYALSYVNSGELSPICSAVYEYTPLSVEIYNFGDEKYGYFFTFSLSYDGIPLDTSTGYSFEFSWEPTPTANTIKLLMLSEKSVDYIWTCVMNKDTPDSQEKAEINIDYEKACEIVSDTLSKEHVFTVSEADLIYYTPELKDENAYWTFTGIKLEPTWQFNITDVDVQEYKSLCIDVSATDGKVYMSYE